MKLYSRKIAGIVVAFVIAGVAPLNRLRAQELSLPLSDLQHTTDFDVTPTPLGLRSEVSDSTKYPRTYWLEGALIGGIPLALLGVTLGAALCADPDSGGGTEPCWDDALLGLVTGFGVGGSLGGLIGGLIKKSEKKDQKAPADE